MTREQIKKADPNHYLIVDIRERYETATQPGLPNSINIPMSELGLALQKGELPKNKIIVTVCRSGARCYAVNNALSAAGYETDMLDGGLISS